MISVATSPADILRCFPVMQQLRPHLKEEQFLAQVRRQQRESGYVLAYIEDNGAVQACAGYRIAEYLAWGKALYVDDLIADESTRGQGYASQLFDWLVECARAADCDQFHLDSGTGPTRYRAHRFYLHKGMDITSHHFAMKVSK